MFAHNFKTLQILVIETVKKYWFTEGTTIDLLQTLMLIIIIVEEKIDFWIYFYES